MRAHARLRVQGALASVIDVGDDTRVGGHLRQVLGAVAGIGDDVEVVRLHSRKGGWGDIGFIVMM